jgi:hypothetical protein
MLFFHPVQILAIAAKFCPSLWVTPPRPPDSSPISRRTVVDSKAVGGLTLSQIICCIPTNNLCLPDSLCDIIHGRSLAQSTLRPDHSPSAPAPICMPHIPSLLKTTCSMAIIPPRPASICRNHIHPTFEWGRPRHQYPPSLWQNVTAPNRPFQSFSATSVLMFISASRRSLHRAAPISRALLIAAWLAYMGFLGHVSAMVSVVVSVPVKFVAHHCRSWRWRQTMEKLARIKNVLIIRLLGCLRGYLHTALLGGLTILVLAMFTRSLLPWWWWSCPSILCRRRTSCW